MRVRALKRQAAQAVMLDIDFASVVGQTSQDTTYKFTYTIDRPNILGAGVVGLELAIVTKHESQKMNLFAFDASSSALTPQKLVTNILSKNATDLSIVAADSAVIAKFNADFTSAISNDTAERGAMMQSSIRYVAVDSVVQGIGKASSIPSAVPLSQPDKPVVAYTPQALKLLTKGIDPTSVVIDKPTTQGDLLNGTKKITATIDKLLLYSELINQTSVRRKAIMSAASDNAMIALRETLSVRTSRITKTVTVMNDALGTRNSFYLRIRLFGKQQTIVDEIVRRVDHAALVNEYLTPKIAPTVLIAKANITGKNVLHITQRDPVATSVEVFRKIMRHNVDDVFYKSIGTFLATQSSGTITIRDVVDNSNTIVYRVIPVGKNGAMCNAFASAVTVPIKRQFVDKRFSDNRADIVITALHVSEGIQLRAYNYHDDVIAVQFMRKNISRHARNWSVVNNDFRMRKAHGGDSSSIDQNVEPGQIFEYTARLTFRTGSVQIANNITTIQHVDLKNAKAVVQVGNSTITQGERTNVQFDVITNVDDSMLNVAKRIIEQGNLSQFFGKELNDERALLNKLIVTYVERIDLNRGIVENMGIIVGQVFDDAVQSQLTAAQPLSASGRYRYVLYTYQRDPETVFDALVKTATHRGRDYSYSPAKYRSPAALRRSTIVTRTSHLRTNATESLIFGDLVSIEKIDVVMQATRPTVATGTIQTTNRGKTLRWTIKGDIKLIDHFIIFARRFETTEPIATVHTQNTKNPDAFMYDDRNGHDVDSYEIVAVYQNYETDSTFVARQSRGT